MRMNRRFIDQLDISEDFVSYIKKSVEKYSINYEVECDEGCFELEMTDYDKMYCETCELPTF